MNHQNLRITIALASPLRRLHNLTLDGVLSGILFSEGMAGDEAAKCEMVARWEGVPMASQAILDNDFARSQHSIQRIMGRHMMNNREIYSRVDQKTLLRMSGGSAANSSHDIDNMVSTTSQLIETKEVIFYARGDERLITSTLARCGFIGSQTRKGFGEIKKVSAKVLDSSLQHVGIVHAGRLMRPIPEDLVRSLGVLYRRDHGRYESPYSPMLAARLGLESQMIACPMEEFMTKATAGV